MLRDRLRFRSDLLRKIRAFFYERGFVEVDTPLLVRSPGLEVHLRAVRASGGWLITSPEYHMKRLLARGTGPIFQLVHCFREDELGRHHAREFTMLEWYRPNEPYESLITDIEGLFTCLASDRPELRPPFERLTVDEAFVRYVGQDPHALDEDAFFLALVDKVEPHLGQSRPTVLLEWPARYAALARLKPNDSRVAQRFELYAGGIELVNAFGELNDPVEQRARFEAEQRERRGRGLEVYPIDEKFLDDLARMPEASGAALGLDRLAMLLAGATDIRDVMTFRDVDV